MKKLIIIALLVGGGYQAWQGYHSNSGSLVASVATGPLFDEPYVAVYGRNSCGFTQGLINELKASNVPYRYYIVDEKPVADRLHATMADQGLNIRRYNLPVVDVNGDLVIRPSLIDVKVRLSSG